jgi:PAS domain S-box-containing protein
MDQPPALYFLYKYGIQDQFNRSAPLPSSNAFHRAVRKGNVAVLNLVTEGFARISRAEYQAIDRRWLGTGETANLQPFLPYLVSGAVVALIVVLVLIALNRTLQQQVRQRTQELEATAEALHESRRFLADLIEHGGALIFVKDREGRYELINRKWEEVTGLTRAEVIGRTDEVLFPGPIGQQFRANDLEVIESGNVLEREEILDDAGGRRSFISIKFPVRGEDGHIKGVCGMTTEITERKRAEEALAESEEVFRLFMEHSPIYVFFKDEQTRSLRLSKNYEQMLGRPVAELLGKTMDELFPSDLAKSMIADDLRILNEGRQVDVVEELNGRVYKTTKFPISRPGRPSWLAGYTIDITEQTRAAEALRQSEDKFAKAFHTSPDSININRLSDGLYLEINEGFTAITGYTSADVKGKTSLELNIWADLADRARLVQGLREHGEVTNLEAPFRMKDGRVITGLMSARIIEVAGEQCILSITRDITARKQAEAEIESLSRFPAENPSPVLRVDRDGDILYANEASQQLLQAWVRTTGDVTLAYWRRLAIETLAGGANRSVDVVYDRHVFSFSVVPILEGGYVNLYGRDITERKQVESQREAALAALRDSEERYQNFISQSFEGISRTEFDHPIDITLPVETQIDLIYENAYMAECNQALAAMYHLPSPEALIGARLSEAHGGTDNPVNRAAFRKLIENGYKSMGDETIEYRADGEPVWFLSNTVGTIENGYLVRLWGTALDITERKQAEAAIRQLNQNLEQRVADRTRELAAANARLTELDQLKSKFVSDVSHELRTPIANLKLYIDLLAHGKPEKQAQYLQVLQQQVRRVTALVDDILDLSRLERRKEQGVIYRAVALNDVVDQVVLAHQPRAEADGLQLTFAPAAHLPPVRADANQLAQVVTNLIANALSYTSAGYVRVSTSTENSEVCLCVADSGSGIAPDDLPHVFERFYRGQHVLKNDVPGTGLGLAIVKEIVDLHEGRIEVDSQPGHGTTFRVWLPLA